MNIVNLKVVFFILFIFYIFKKQISKQIKKLPNNKYINDNQVKQKISILDTYTIFDERSVIKTKFYLRKFFIEYSKSYGIINEKSLNKMKEYKFKVLKYLNRIGFRIINDELKERNFRNLSSAFDNILDNYLFEAYDRNGKKYFKKF